LTAERAERTAVEASQQVAAAANAPVESTNQQPPAQPAQEPAPTPEPTP
ncbi:MAG TPA: peptidase M23, partial [Halomonas sp.]|nr:peptidase M23 [Halomonas sp.]HCL23655.1 peptidase M23 [Halomonas sp.]